MSKVIFFCIPAHGHVNAHLALAEGLVRQGEDVIYYCGAGFRAKVRPLCGVLRVMGSSSLFG